MSSTLPPLDLPTEVFPHFPSLSAQSSSAFVYADNAGGSQTLGTCVDAVSDFLLRSNVQMGGGYPLSIKAQVNISEGAKATGPSDSFDGVEGGKALR